MDEKLNAAIQEIKGSVEERVAKVEGGMAALQIKYHWTDVKLPSCGRLRPTAALPAVPWTLTPVNGLQPSIQEGLNSTWNKTVQNLKFEVYSINKQVRASLNLFSDLKNVSHVLNAAYGT